MYDTSYPPSLWKPKATGATAGIPGVFTPPGNRIPPNLAAMSAWGIVASPATPWTTGQFVQTGTAGAAGRVTWSGTSWVGGAAPLDVASMTVAEVEAYVTEHPDELDAVRAAEQAGKGRSTLLAWLDAQAAPPVVEESAGPA